MYVGLENADKMAAIDTLSNKVIANVPIGQAPQALTYVPNAVPDGAGTDNLMPLGSAGEVAHLTLALAKDGKPGKVASSVSLFDQGLIQVLQASVTGLEPKKAYVLALAKNEAGHGTLQPLSAFMTNPAGSAIVNAIGPIRQLAQHDSRAERRYLVIAEGTAAQPGSVVQVEAK
jgi:YVTN family beta-propeller protein